MAAAAAGTMPAVPAVPTVAVVTSASVGAVGATDTDAVPDPDGDGGGVVVCDSSGACGGIGICFPLRGPGPGPPLTPQPRHERLQRRRSQRLAHARQLRLVPHRRFRRAVSRRPGRIPQNVLDRAALPARRSAGEVGGAEKVLGTYEEVRGGVVRDERGDCGSLDGDVSVQGGVMSTRRRECERERERDVCARCTLQSFGKACALARRMDTLDRDVASLYPRETDEADET